MAVSQSTRSWRRRLLPERSLIVIVAAVFILAAPPCAAARFTFDQCLEEIHAIRDGTQTVSNITGKTITLDMLDSFNYTGETRLSKEKPRPDNFFTLTLEGCSQVCGNQPELDYDNALPFAANWLLPILALLANLTWDSPHGRLGRKWSQIWGAISNWLGSPQTALTATMFNLYLIGRCYHRTSAHRSKHKDSNQEVLRDVYFIASCMGQFSLSEEGKAPEHDHHLQRQEINRPNNPRFYEVLSYGLFRPLDQRDGVTPPRDVALTRNLIKALAFQLRMLRRRGVYPSMLNLLAFGLAFIFSIVQAFSSLGDRSTAHSLAFGLLVLWMPMLVGLSIIDRNPVSADRSKKLIERWLRNVSVIRTDLTLPDENANDALEVQSRWWRPPGAGPPETHASSPPEHQGIDHTFALGQFIGQGRVMWYAGLTYSILKGGSMYSTYEEGQKAQQQLHGTAGGDQERFLAVGKAMKDFQEMHRRPAKWYFMAVWALLSIMFDVFIAFMVSFNTPTVGLGCRSFSYVLWGILSTITWIAHLFLPFPRRSIRIVFHCINVVSVLWLAAIMFLQMFGALNFCFCKASAFAGGPGYIDFESSDFYREHFDVEAYWIAGAVLGCTGAVVVSFVGYVWFYRDFRTLWQAREDEEGILNDVVIRTVESGRQRDAGTDGVELIDFTWLR